MAAMTTALTEYTDNGNTRVFTYTGHVSTEPRLVIETRKDPSTVGAVLEDTIKVVSSTEDASGELLQSRVTFEAKVRRPNNGIAADVTAALAIFRDIIAGDEFTNTVSTQEWLV